MKEAHQLLIMLMSHPVAILHPKKEKGGRELLAELKSLRRSISASCHFRSSLHSTRVFIMYISDLYQQIINTFTVLRGGSRLRRGQVTSVQEERKRVGELIKLFFVEKYIFQHSFVDRKLNAAVCVCLMNEYIQNQRRCFSFNSFFCYLFAFSFYCLVFLFNSSEAAQPNATIKAQQNSNWVHLTRKNKKKVE